MTATPVYLEAARLSDVPLLVALEQASQSHPWSAQAFSEAIEGGGGVRVALVRKPRGDLVGYCVWQEVADEAHVHNLAIAPGERRQGLGRRVLAACLGLAGTRHARRAFLDVRAGNEAALSLYHALGFRHAGVRPRYYSDPAEDAVLMEAFVGPNGILKSGDGAC